MVNRSVDSAAGWGFGGMGSRGERVAVGGVWGCMARRGFSIFGLLLVLVFLGVMACVVAVMGRGLHRSMHGADQIKDAIQLRNLAQATRQFAQANDGHWLMTWDSDADDAAWAKNTTASLYERFVFQQLVTPEMLVSVVETNRNVGMGKAIPASYAHQQPTVARAPTIERAAFSTYPLFSNRFPEVVGVTARASGSVTTPFANPKSHALRAYGTGDAWRGNVVYADGHAAFESGWLQAGGVTPTLELETYEAADGTARADLPFWDEADDPTGTNHYLGIFTAAGRERGDFTAVWD